MLLKNIDKTKSIHMIGIGGTSMSGIAEIILNMGFKVTGSDMNQSIYTENLEKSGINIYIGCNPDNVNNSALVVYTAAIKQDNPELVRAKELGIPTMERSEFLGEITKLYEKTISVCGTHGKTTTTSMISSSFIEDGKEPTVQVGANIKALNNANYRVGNSPYFILESCEYVRSFLKFHPQTVALLNIEEDHLDYYKDLEDIKSAFKEFVSLVPETGYVIVNSDNSNCMDVVKNLNSKVITIGIENKNADFYADNIHSLTNGCYAFDVHFSNNVYQIELNILGYHNVYNALITLAVSITHGVSISSIITALKEFTGASRRFEYVGTVNGAKIYDDYAHHPTEIKATLESATKIQHNKIWAVFQPHTYSRTKSLFNEFSDAFEKADTLILVDIYAAREKDDGSVSSKMLAEKINEKYGNCIYIPTIEEAGNYLKSHVSENDVILTIGAGTVTQIGYKIKE